VGQPARHSVWWQEHPHARANCATLCCRSMCCRRRMLGHRIQVGGSGQGRAITPACILHAQPQQAPTGVHRNPCTTTSSAACVIPQAIKLPNQHVRAEDTHTQAKHNTHTHTRTRALGATPPLPCYLKHPHATRTISSMAHVHTTHGRQPGGAVVCRNTISPAGPCIQHPHHTLCPVTQLHTPDDRKARTTPQRGLNAVPAEHRRPTAGRARLCPRARA
jgi:hypothetical protein